ncbi:MAG: LCP family protein [Clostridia bacterium]|nr:LCP family protein [Clostridia bacterium]
MSDKNIDYQMYLDYLDGKQGEPKPDPQPEKTVDEILKQAKPKKAYSEKTEIFSEPERPLSKIEEIEQRYHLDHDGENPHEHLMTDEEFAQKYGSKNAYKKRRNKKESYEEPQEEDILPPVPEDSYGEQTQSLRDSGYEDVYSYDVEKEGTVPDGEADLSEGIDEENEEPQDGDAKKGKGKKKKWWKILIAVVLILGILGTIAYVKREAIIDFVTAKMFSQTKTGKEDTNVWKQLETGDDKNHGDMFYESSANETYSLEDWFRSWQKAEGQNMYNDKIINVLLIGMDDPEGSEYGRSDAMIMISIDTINQKLKLTSVWRDTYGLIQIPKVEGKQEAGENFEKINGANYYGGPELTVKTIESLYKTRIDGYVMTTFDSFADLIDAMGGIYVDVTEEENEFLTETAQYSWHASAGKNVKLNGLEALVYSRIRKLDSDIKRTERQRKVMSAMLDRIGELSTTQLFSTVTDYLDKGYVTTNFSEKDISKLGTKAVFGGWKDFEMEQMTAPISGEVEPENYQYYWGGTYRDAWVWIVDIPKTATDVQKFIYGETFCQLNENRHSISEFVTGGIH